MIFQPKGAASEHKEGTILVQSTVAGEINHNFKNNNTGCAPCTASCGPC